VSNAKAAKAGDRPNAARAAARPSRGSGRGGVGAASARDANRKSRAPSRAPRAVDAPATVAGAGARPGRPARGADVERAGTPHYARTRAAATRGLGGDQVEGRQAVRELLLAGRRKTLEVWVASDQDEAVVLDDIAELAMSVGVPVRDVARSKLFARAKTEAPQGVLALAHELPEVDIDDLFTRPKNGPAPFLLAVDGVTDPGNLGALLRSAECAGVSGVVLPRHRSVHITPTVAKTAAGAVEYLRMAIVGGLPSAIVAAQKAGVWVVGLDGGGDETLFDLSLADEPVMLVLGAEGKGLSRLVRARCDVVAAIPLGGRLSSLNVASAGALACFEVARRRHLAGASTR
jgi:23S rRNA (guanosine2251-2'-O)-methyltransferase